MKTALLFDWLRFHHEYAQNHLSAVGYSWRAWCFSTQQAGARGNKCGLARLIYSTSKWAQPVLWLRPVVPRPKPALPACRKSKRGRCDHG